MEGLSSYRLKDIINGFKNRKVAVIGDFVLDVYVHSLATRVSREAPVLILRYEGESVALGGGANAANNARSLGAYVYALGYVGDDAEGERLVSEMKACGINTDGIVFVPGRKTVTKTRILAGAHHTVKQQVLRIDKEPDNHIPEEFKKELLGRIGSLKNEVDAVIISDYGYSCVNKDVFQYVKNIFAGKIITVDSRYRVLEFKGVTAATPNEPETASALGLEKVDDNNIVYAGKKMLELTANEAVLITRGKKGMALFEKSGAMHFIDIYGSDEVADVTGAGDTVIATFTLSLAEGASFFEAAKIANYAGGIVVMKMGTATVSPLELLKAVEDDLEGSD